MAKKKNSPKRRERTSEQRTLLASAVGGSIAERLRGYRLGLGLTVRALATLSGVSPSMVSEAERGAKTPSIAVLIALAEALGISLSQLVAKEASRGPIELVARRDQRVLVDRSGVRREHLGPTVAGSQLEFVRFVLPAGTATGELSAHRAGSIEHAHVAAGTVEIQVAGERRRAETGDSIVFPADQSHGYANVGSGEAEVYVVVEPLVLRVRAADSGHADSHLREASDR